MHLKTHRVKRHGKEHVYYSLCESVRVSRRRVVQRQVLHLGELQGSQVAQWERTIAVLTESGEERQMQLWAGRPAPAQSDCVEVVLSSLSVRRPRRFGDCWAVTKLWTLLDLDGFFAARLDDEPGAVSWAKVIELLVVSRLCAPGSELSVHQRFYPQSAIGWLLDTDAAVAEKDRLYRALDRLLPLKAELEQHLARRWQDLFGVTCELLLYDLTSSYFEGEAAQVEQASRGYSRDHRPDCVQVVLALIVTPEGLPVAYEVFDGNRVDVTTLQPMIDHVEARHGKMGRVWVFDRGIVSEANLSGLRARGGHYLVGTPRSALGPREAHLLAQDWQAVSPEVEVKLLPEDGETYVLARSRPRAAKEQAMRTRIVRGLMRDLIRLRRSWQRGRVHADRVWMRLGRLEERHGRAWRWDRERLRKASLRDGAYLLRTNLTATEPTDLWRRYVQLSEVEAAFRVFKSELGVRPIWHYTQSRVEAHILVAFLGYALWACLRNQLRRAAPGLMPAAVFDQLGRLQLVEVWFNLRDGRQLCLERITQPDPAQIALLDALDWRLPEQPPPKIYPKDVGMCGQ
jgi:transposase